MGTLAMFPEIEDLGTRNQLSLTESQYPGMLDY